MSTYFRMNIFILLKYIDNEMKVRIQKLDWISYSMMLRLLGNIYEILVIDTSSDVGTNKMEVVGSVIVVSIKLSTVKRAILQK